MFERQTNSDETITKMTTIENGRLAQKKFFNMEYEDFKNEFANNQYNPIYKLCYELIEKIENGDAKWAELSAELQLMYFAEDSEKTRMFFRVELDETHPDEIENLLKGDFINKDFVQMYWDRYYA
jgi:type IV secretory pathway VirD2 relaxase